MIKIDPYVLKAIESSNFDFSTIDYIDITKNINKGIADDKAPDILTFLYD